MNDNYKIFEGFLCNSYKITFKFKADSTLIYSIFKVVLYLALNGLNH